jgi:nicotinamide-nucleotide amidase
MLLTYGFCEFSAMMHLSMRMHRFMNNEMLELLSQIACQLKVRGQTVAVAESCTGGLLGAAFTELPGSSAYFTGGVLAYDNAVKTDVLGVSHEALLAYGAVSEEVASEMALGARKLFGSDWALSTTGIAGPDGGSPEKPVGTVWIGLADCDGVFSRVLHLSGMRSAVRTETVRAILEMLLETMTAPESDL